MSGSNGSKVLELFDNPTIGQISMFLIFYKELTAGQLAKLADKNISTITRNLERMLGEELIYVSKTEAKGNLQVKFWALNPEIINIDSVITDESIQQLSDEEKQKAIDRMQNVLITFRGILKALYDSQVSNLINKLQNADRSDDSDVFTIFLFNEEHGHLFMKKIREMQEKFFEEYDSDSADLNSITSDSIILFILSSRLGDVIPSIQ